MDWHAWHTDYDRKSHLRQRLLIVQRHIRLALDRLPTGTVRVISMCSGDGRDLLGVLSSHPRRGDVRGRLVELDADLAATAGAHAPPGIEVVCGDASTTGAYIGAVPADLLLVCGVFGSIARDDVERTVRLLPTLCARRAIVIWTRHRRSPDLTPDIRRWFADARFEELAFDAPVGTTMSVGSHRFSGDVAAFAAGVRMFTFVTRER